MTQKFTFSDPELGALIVASDVILTNWLLSDQDGVERFITSRATRLEGDSYLGISFVALASTVGEALSIPHPIAAMRLFLAAKELHTTKMTKDSSLSDAEALQMLLVAIVRGIPKPEGGVN